MEGFSKAELIFLINFFKRSRNLGGLSDKKKLFAFNVKYECMLQFDKKDDVEKLS